MSTGAQTTSLPVDVGQVSALSDAFMKGGPYFLGVLLLSLAFSIWWMRRPPNWWAISCIGGLAVLVLGWALLDWQDTRSRVDAILEQARQEANSLRSGANRQAAQMLVEARQTAATTDQNARREAQQLREQADRDADNARAHGRADATRARDAAQAELARARAEAERIIRAAEASANQQFVMRIRMRYDTNISLRDLQLPMHAMNANYSIYWRAQPHSNELEILLIGRFPIHYDSIEFIYFSVEDSEGEGQRQVVNLPFCLEVLTRADMVQLVRRRLPESQGRYVPQLIGRRGMQEIDGRCS